MRKRISPGVFCVLVYGTVWAAIIWTGFPLDSDPPRRKGASGSQANAAYYDTVYKDGTRGEVGGEYAELAVRGAESSRIKERVTEFARRYGLENKRVLEVGAGSGYLQDVVSDYTGLDISAEARRRFHKRFVQASAAEMPFEDSSFDGLWSIWTLEHVPHPEWALEEIRRVVKPGGVIFPLPAWTCTPWAAEGYPVRPYSDFGLAGKLIKASIPVRSTWWYYVLQRAPVRAMRLAAASVRQAPTRLRYRKLEANYTKYWMEDSDAVSSLDFPEVMLWFRSRGDECLSCAGDVKQLFLPGEELVVRTRK
jgi:SAM-dependent methyltransferase